MRTEAVTLLVILCGVLLIFGIVGWIVFRVEARLRQSAAGIVPGSGSGGVVGVSCGDGGAGCGG